MKGADVKNSDSDERRRSITAKLREYVKMRKILCANYTIERMCFYIFSGFFCSEDGFYFTVSQFVL